MSRRVVVTGLGTINPLGHTVKETWEKALRGESGVGPITLFDASDLNVQIAAEVKDFDPTRYMPARWARRYSRFEQFALVAAQEALQHAGLEPDKEDPTRVGVIISSAIGGIDVLEQNTLLLYNEGLRKVGAFVIPQLMPNGASGVVSIHYGFQGPALSVASACASGNDALGLAWNVIRSGVADVVVAGASEAVICKIAVVAFDRVGAMARGGPDRRDAPRPFDQNRDGFVIAEGAAVLILESEEHARARGAPILAELVGYASSSDAYHITAPHEEGAGAILAMRRALETAGLRPDEVDYINAHGTGTELNDAVETKAIKAVFGDHAYRIPVSSTKSMTGHMMGATGALEAIFCVLAIQHGVVPPTINYTTPDPECDLDYVPNEAREAPVRVAMDNAFGFGGHNAVLIFKKYEG